MTLKYVTTMSRSGFTKYGHLMLDSWTKYWPGSSLMLYYEDYPLPIVDSRIEQFSLLSIPGYTEFQQSVCHFPMMHGIVDGTYNYRYNIARFCKKMFAQWESTKNHQGILCWLDADVITTKHVPLNLITRHIQDKFVAYMARIEWHPCTSFILWDLTHKCSAAWWGSYMDKLHSGKIFSLKEWHDAYVFQSLLVSVDKYAISIASDFTEKGPANVFDHVFAGYAHHLKGSAKESLSIKRGR